jgi:glutathione S-transferase
MSKAITLVYDPICPFAQRAWLALLEKQVPFNKMRVEIWNKSQEFTEIYSKAYARDPTNKGIVPVLVYGEQTFTESDLISWFVSE